MRTIDKRNVTEINKKKITSKDLITIGIFTLFILVIASIAPVLGIIPGMYLMRTPAAAFLCGPIYLLYVAKVKKPFCITITGLICAAIMGLLSFGSFPMFAINLTCFILADIIAGIGKHKSMLWNSISYIVLGFWTIGQDGAFWYMKDFMIDVTIKSGMGEDWLNGILILITPQNLVFVIVATFVASLLSILFARLILKKHFIKVGIV